VSTPAVDIDRIALSAQLGELASRYTIEATLWADEDAHRNLERTARTLAELSRQALHTVDLGVGYAYADAADVLIRQVEGARRFLQTIDTPPSIRLRGQDEHGYRTRCPQCASTLTAETMEQLRATVLNHRADCEHP